MAVVFGQTDTTVFYPEGSVTGKYVYQAFVHGVYDGDTVTLTIQRVDTTDLGFRHRRIIIDQYAHQKFRLYGIDAPELRYRRPHQATQAQLDSISALKQRGFAARNRLRQLILNKWVTLQSIKDSKGKYGRYLANIYAPFDGRLIYVNNWLVAQGLAAHAEY